MDRLTEKTDEGILVKETYAKDSLKTLFQCYGKHPGPNYDNCDESYCAMEKLLRYENMEEQGRMLVLPFLKGDTFYKLVQADGMVIIRPMTALSLTDVVSMMEDGEIGVTAFLLESDALKTLDQCAAAASHCIGLGHSKPYTRHGKQFYQPYRNYYSTADDYGDQYRYWKIMESFGYAFRSGRNSHGGYTFHMTPKGLEWLGGRIGVKIHEKTR